MIDDRPIKPDRKYLQEYIERISKVEKKAFLKRKSQPVLPCFSHIPEKHQNGSIKIYNQKSKAQLYEQIKEKNKKRFGEKKIQIVEDPPAKKIDPSKMTVNYKPKYGKAKIDTEEYKLKKETSPNPRTKSIANKQEKVQYDRLLDYFQKQLSEFEKEKEQFSKVAGKLKFKQSISHQPGLQYSRVKKQVQSTLLNHNINMAIEQNTVRQGHSGQNNKIKTVRECQNKQRVNARKQLSKTYSIEQIHKCMERTSQQMHKLKQKMLNRQLLLQQHRYDIHQIYLLPRFDPITIYDYIDHKKLKYNGNQYYNQAISAFNSKFERGQQDPKVILNQQEQNMIKKTIKVKYVGEKRVMKYEGWTEVWIPGKQRLMANKEGYKVIWLGNGDVLQEFPNSIKTYYYKVKDIVKIEFKKEPAIYYHHPTHQLWRIVQNKVRQTVFSNGAQQGIQQKQKDDDF